MRIMVLMLLGSVISLAFARYLTLRGPKAKPGRLVIGACGNKVSEGGVPDAITLMRLLEVRGLYWSNEELPQGALVVCTGTRGPDSIGAAMKQHLLDWFIPSWCLLESNGVGTFAEGRGVFDWAIQLSAGKVMMVTSDWHANAARPFWNYLAYKSGIELEVVGLDTGWIEPKQRRDYFIYKILIQLVLLPAYIGFDHPLKLLEQWANDKEEKRVALRAQYEPAEWREQLR